MVGQEAEGARGKCGPERLLWFLKEGTGDAGETGLGLAGLNNFSGLWGIGAGPSCLAPGPGVTRTEIVAPECESLIMEVVGLWVLDWLVCTWKRHGQ